MGENVTIHNVAAEANVSIATVSRVLNNIGSVKESTRERVYQAMRTVGYPIPEADTPESAGNKTILIMATNLGNVYTGRTIDGILSAANFAGYECVVYKQKNAMYSFEHMRSIAESVNACGILISWPDVPAEIITKLSEIYPLVQVAEYAQNCGAPYVSVDDRASAKIATSYLLRLGYRRIGLINGPKQYKYARDREKGYLEALREFGIEPEAELSITVSYNARLAASQLVNLPNPPDAIVAAVDTWAIAVLRALNEAGKTAPKDIAVISCEDTELAQSVSPALSAVSQPVFHIGEQACKMLIEMINGHDVSPNQISLDVELVVREST